MSQIIIKKEKPRFDQKRPESHPDYKKALKVGEQRASKLKFESEGEKRDYEKAVKSNPNTIYGLPNFFPPMQITSFIHMPDISEEQREQMALERFLERLTHTTHLLCQRCDQVTEHWISPSQCFCSKCGKKNRYRNGSVSLDNAATNTHINPVT